MKTREEIIRDNPLSECMEACGIVLKGSGAKRQANRCPEVEHKPQHLCVSVDEEKQVWYCNDCQKGGSIIDFVAFRDGISAAEAMRKLGGVEDATTVAAPVPSRSRSAVSESSNSPSPKVKPTIVWKYDYTDSKGEFAYQVCRLEPKSFRQRHKNPDGSWNWSMDGVRRVLYNLPAVKAADYVWIVEGEKDADTLGKFGFVATCNVGGAGKWEPSYSSALKGKDVLLCGDTDEAGRKHVEKVNLALAAIARTVTVVTLPDEYKDVTEFIESFETPKEGAAALLDIAGKSEVLHGGYKIPIKSIAELEADYREFAKKVETCSLSLGRFLPRLGNTIRPLVPGELMTFLAATGCGKTMLLDNIAKNTRLVTLKFQLELPGTLTFERHVGMETGLSGEQVMNRYRFDEEVDWKSKGGLNHIYVCSEPKITVSQATDIIEKAGLKIGSRPQLVLMDYVQLIGGEGSGRYERASSVAEEIKVMAKATNTIVVIASQVGRESSGAGEEVTLYSGKDSGSIENSSGLVIGAWRDADEPRLTMWLKVLKNTKGTAGQKTTCRIGSDMVLVEEPEDRNSEELIPAKKTSPRR